MYNEHSFRVDSLAVTANYRGSLSSPLPFAVQTVAPLHFFLIRSFSIMLDMKNIGPSLNSLSVLRYSVFTKKISERKKTNVGMEFNSQISSLKSDLRFFKWVIGQFPSTIFLYNLYLFDKTSVTVIEWFIMHCKLKHFRNINFNFWISFSSQIILLIEVGAVDLIVPIVSE